MSNFYNSNGESILNFSFPKEKFETILTKLGLAIDGDFRKEKFERKRLVFLAAFREFLGGTLFLEEFCEIANHVTARFEMETRTLEQQDYETVIYEAADISLAVRTAPMPDFSSISATLSTIWDFFNKYKHYLDEVSVDFPIVDFFENPKNFLPGNKVIPFEEMRKIIEKKAAKNDRL